MSDEKNLSNNFKNSFDLILGQRFSVKQIFCSSESASANVKYNENNIKSVASQNPNLPNVPEDLLFSVSKRRMKNKIIQ